MTISFEFTQNKVKSGAESLTIEKLIKSWLQGWFWRCLKPLNLASHKGMVLKKALHTGVPGGLNKTFFLQIIGLCNSYQCCAAFLFFHNYK
jgi:hypothetical protein